MNKAHAAGDVRIGKSSGGDDAAAPSLAGLLALAATPAFAAMAVWTGWFAGRPDALCLGLRGALSFAGPMTGMAAQMTAMYVLMSVFHMQPWLKAISHRQPRQGRRS